MKKGDNSIPLIVAYHKKVASFIHLKEQTPYMGNKLLINLV